MILDALGYPLRQGGWTTLVAGAIFAVALDFLTAYSAAGIITAVFGAGYFGAYYMNIIGSTMAGRDELPDWPGFSNWRDDIFNPWFQLLAVIIISFAPLLVLIGVSNQKDANEEYFVAALAFGCLYYPAAILAYLSFGSLKTALPYIVLPAIFRMMPGYLLVLVALVVAFVLSALTQSAVSRVPYIGWFPTACVALYGVMFQGRLIGLLYRKYETRLKWD